MKKFSNVSGFSVPNEPQPPKPKDTTFESGIMQLMDNLLSIRMYGPVNRYAVAGLIEVSGKELFLEALKDYLKSYSDKEKIKLLESLKEETGDWELLDNKIEKIKEDISLSDSIFLYKSKIKSYVQKYSDETILLSKIKESCNRLKKEDIQIRVKACQQLLEESKNPIFSKISKVYRAEH